MKIFKDCQNCSNLIVKREANIHRQLLLKNSKLNYENKELQNRIDKAIEYCQLNKEFTPRLEDIENILEGKDKGEDSK